MRVYTSRVVTVFVVLAAFLVPSCFAAASTRPHPNMRPMVSKQMQSLLYVGDYGRNQIDVFQAGVPNPQQVGTITRGIDQPVDIAVDTNGTLYVANTGHEPGSVAIFPAGSSAPSEIIALPAQNAAANIGVGPDGTIYVATIKHTSHYFVVEYDPGQTSPSRIVRLPYYNAPCCATVQGMAFDSSDNMYVNYGEGNLCCGYAILVYAPRALHVTSRFTVGFAFANGGIAIDGDDSIFIGDSRVVRVARLPNHDGYLRSIPTPMSSNSYLALDAKTDYLYTPISGGVQAYDATSGKKIGSPITGLADPRGIAVYPPTY